MAKGQITTRVSGAAFGSALQAARQRTGMSQSESCKRAGVSISQWSRWESGRVIPYLATIAVIAEVFGLNDADLGALVRLVQEADTGDNHIEVFEITDDDGEPT